MQRPNPTLAAELRANIVGAADGLDLDCHGRVCKAVWPNPPRPNWHNSFYDEPWVRKLVERMAVGHAFTSSPCRARAPMGWASSWTR